MDRFDADDRHRTRCVGLHIRDEGRRYYFREGYSAAEYGDERDSNPHPGSPEAEKAWSEGWDAAASEDKVGYLWRPEP